MEDFENYIIGGDELFNNPRFINHHKYMVDEYIPRIEKPIAFFLSCSKYKPYYQSPYRRLLNAMLEKNLGIKNLSQIYTISEPAIIVPEELDDSIITQYDFPPKLLTEKGRKIFIERLVQILPKLILSHKFCFYILPKHHKEIFEEAINIIIKEKKYSKLGEKLIYGPPITYNLPKVRLIIEKTIKLKNL